MVKRANTNIIGEVGSIKFPISEAFKYCMESIRKRFTRTVITSLSVLLSIAFLVSLLTMGEILRRVGAGGTEEYQIWVAIIALLVCGVGIINSMLMSVTERYKEIGTIKCLGATDSAVLEIFLIEALLLGIIGGIIGALVGWSITVVIHFIQGINIFFEGAIFTYMRIIGMAIGISALISITAAAYPAYYAAKLKPAEALRYEI
ncbi:MAG: FtsX-like permease family protein [Candidatus Bathyarchaeia archaeon]